MDCLQQARREMWAAIARREASRLEAKTAFKTYGTRALVSRRLLWQFQHERSNAQRAFSYVNALARRALS